MEVFPSLRAGLFLVPGSSVARPRQNPNGLQTPRRAHPLIEPDRIAKAQPGRLPGVGHNRGGVTAEFVSRVPTTAASVSAFVDENGRRLLPGLLGEGAPGRVSIPASCLTPETVSTADGGIPRRVPAET